MRKVFTLKKDDIEDLCTSLSRIADVQISDRNFAVLDKKWIEEKAYPAYRKWLNFHGLSKWRTNWDCDDFSNSFKQFLQILHCKHNPATFTEQKLGKKNQNTTDAESIAVGVINYNTGGSYHAINVIVNASGFGFSPKGTYHVCDLSFFEPDGGVEVNLKPEEKESICYISF